MLWNMLFGFSMLLLLMHSWKRETWREREGERGGGRGEGERERKRGTITSKCSETIAHERRSSPATNLMQIYEFKLPDFFFILVKLFPSLVFLPHQPFLSRSRQCIIKSKATRKVDSTFSFSLLLSQLFITSHHMKCITLWFCDTMRE